MRRSDVRGDGARRRSASARDHGWDDSLYDRRPPRRMVAPPRQRGYVRNDEDYYDDGYYDDGYDDGYDDAYYDDDYWEPPRRKRRVLRWFVGTVAFLILGTAGAGWLYYQHLNANLKKDELNLGTHQVDKKPPNAAGQQDMNILLIGSDSRASKENQKLGGARRDADRPPLADVQMLLHVSADRSNMSAVSIPRDTLVDIPECKGSDGKLYPEQKMGQINSSLQHGGPGCTVATWENLTRVHIDHFMMIDFAGVVKMADAVGGVPVCVKDNIYDRYSHLKLRKGTTTVKGVQALAWLRTRHGFEDGSDIGRTHAQHLYMNAMVRQLKAGAKLTDPGKLRSLAEAATNALTVDNGLGSVKKLYDLGNDLKKVPAKRLTMTTMPFRYDDRFPGRVLPKEPDASQIWKMLRGDNAFDGQDKKKKKDPDAAPTLSAAEKGAVPVTVQNGTGTAAVTPVSGRAGAVASRLQNLGYPKAMVDTTPRSQADTTITYGTTSQRAGALSVAKSIGLPAGAVKQSSAVRQITLVVGMDWRTGAAYPKGKASAYGGDKAPDSSTPLNAGDKTACMDVYTEGGYTW